MVAKQTLWRHLYNLPSPYLFKKMDKETRHDIGHTAFYVKLHPTYVIRQAYAIYRKGISRTPEPAGYSPSRRGMYIFQSRTERDHVKSRHLLEEKTTFKPSMKSLHFRLATEDGLETLLRH